jgi:hypothetical protein
VISHTSGRFRKLFSALPKHIQQQAREAYKQFKKNPFSPGLNFKQVHAIKPIYSVRINIEYRAVGIKSGNEIIWFWIGSHDDHDKLLRRV